MQISGATIAHSGANTLQFDVTEPVTGTTATSYFTQQIVDDCDLTTGTLQIAQIPACQEYEIGQIITYPPFLCSYVSASG